MKPVNEKALFKVALAVVDTALVAGGFMLAYWLRFHLPVFTAPPKADLGTYVRFSAFISFAGFVTLYTSGMYRLQQPFFGIDDFFAMVKSGTLSHLIAAAVSFAIRGRIPGDEIETKRCKSLVNNVVADCYAWLQAGLGVQGTGGFRSTRRRTRGTGRVCSRDTCVSLGLCA